MPTTIHIVGLGKTGADFIAAAIEQAPEDFLADSRQRFTALALDIGDQNLQQVEAAAAKLPGDQSQVRTLALEAPGRDKLFSSLRRYREFLKLEFPRYYWNPNYEPWLPDSLDVSVPSEEMPRALTKAIYGMSYYEEPNLVEKELEDFAKSVNDTKCQSVVCIVFDLGDSVGNGIVVDMARHLSNVKFGRRALVLGVGIVPCEGSTNQQAGSIFPVMNELDCMLDQDKNDGVVQVWGDLYRDPFTAGFLMVPQKPAWEETKDLAATQKHTYEKLAAFLLENQSIDLYESLKLLNWVGASASQHSAARSQYGKRWCHILGFMDLDGEMPDVESLPGRLGLLVEGKYSPDYFEIRTSADAQTVSDDALIKISNQMNKVFSPLVEPGIVRSEAGGKPAIGFILPGASKNELEIFFQSRDAYDQMEWDEKLLVHSWLLELGVLLSEPAIRFQGMAGECLWGCACWVVVPYDAIRGEEPSAELKRRIDKIEIVPV